MDRRDFVAASAGLAFVGGVSGVHASAPVKLTPVMEQAREAGLKSLKPTALELEHGLRLHAESVYGFAPRAGWMWTR